LSSLTFRSSSTVDPIIEIKAFGKSRYSKVVKEVGSGATYWGEHFFFEKQFQVRLFFLLFFKNPL